MDNFLIIFTILITLLANGYYIFTIFQGKTKPHIYTWIVRTIVPFFVWMIQLQNGAGWWALTSFLNSSICFIVVWLAIRYWEKNITRTDTISLVLAFCILPIWLGAKQDLIAIWFALSIDFLSYYPTVRKSYQKPFEEDMKIFYASNIALMNSIFLMKNSSIITIIYPTVVIFFNFLFIGYIYWRRKVIKH